MPTYNSKCIEYLEQSIASALKLDVHDVKLNKIVVYYWKEGTHYTKPLIINAKKTAHDDIFEKYTDIISPRQHPADCGIENLVSRI
jgi:hypothetical protein